MTTSTIGKLFNRTGAVFKNTKYLMTPGRIQIFPQNKMSTNVSVSQSNDKETFLDSLPCVIETVQNSEKLRQVPEVSSWIKKMLEYNLAGGKMNRGLATVFAYEMVEKPNNVTEESLRRARVLGWCVEILQAHFLVADDMIDCSTTRRGVPCWYRLPNVGLGAINDSILLSTVLFHILKIHFGHLPQYTEILDLFNETILLTSAGQHLDITMTKRKKNDYSLFTMESYEAIVKYKTAYYTYRLPIALGMLLANITNKTALAKADSIALDLGRFFQIQDDFIDCYSDESVSGKAGTDIQEGKCSWLAVTAIQNCNESQLYFFTRHYGTKKPVDVQRIKQLYEELEIPRRYRELEKTQYDAIVSKVNELDKDTDANPKLFLKLLDMINNRRV